MALGMEKAGFDLLMANELSPMAGETFAHNILKKKPDANKDSKTLSLSSRFPKGSSARERENPFEAIYGGHGDIGEKTSLKGKLVIGDVRQLLGHLESFESLRDQLKGVDLLSGGPPCQGFSLAGLRIKNDYKNSLPWTFAKVAGLLQPKAVLLENVKGITAPFREGDSQYYAWLEISKAFALEGFVPVCMMVNSKYFGVPQNRPRFVMIAIRHDLYIKAETFVDAKIYGNSLDFYEAVKNPSDANSGEAIKRFKYWGIENDEDLKLFDGNLLPIPVTDASNWVSVKDAIDDLSIPKRNKLTNVSGRYAKQLNEFLPQPEWHPTDYVENHEERGHNNSIKARFGYYQLISGLNGSMKDAEAFLKSEVSPTEYGDLYESIFSKAFKGKKVLLPSGKYKVLKKVEDFHSYVQLLPKTKKHSQRALLETEPAPAQLTIPDDLCHYQSGTPRTLTVREMARLQSFPDWFEFKSKVTTGGQNRSFEVPQYTQVGNAVPPLLAYHLGDAVSKMLDKIEKHES